jgi:hypothetical protein
MEVVMATLTGVLVLVTAVYVYLTHRLVDEAHKSRIAAAQAHVGADVEMEKRIYWFTVRSFGRSPARDIEITIDPPMALKYGNDNKPLASISYSGLGVDQVRNYIIGATHEFWGSDRAREYTVVTQWTCPVSGRHEQRHRIDMNSFRDNVDRRNTSAE